MFKPLFKGHQPWWVGKFFKQADEPVKININFETHCPGCKKKYEIEDGQLTCTDPNCSFWED